VLAGGAAQSAAEGAGGRTRRPAWLIVGLVFLFMLINYADKAVIGLASVPIMAELGLNHAQFGLLGSSFFLLFSVSGVLVGLLTIRLGSRAIMWLMSTVWAAALLPMIRLSSFSALLCSRVALGAAEGPAFPVAVHAVYQWFPDRRRALPTSVVASGAAFGTGIVAPLISLIIVHFGWHAAFGVLGVAGLAWGSLWLLLVKQRPPELLSAAGAGAGAGFGAGAAQPMPLRQLLCSRTAIGVYLAGFAAYWLIALNIVWLAGYLRQALRMTPAQAAWVIALPALMQLLLAPCLAWLSQRLSLRGASSRIARGLLGTLCVIVSGVAIECLPLVRPGVLQIGLIGLGFSIGSVIFTLGPTLIGEISPSVQRGAALSVANSIHTLAGLIAPLAMGLVVDVNLNASEGFRTGYLYAGALVISLGVLAAVLIDPAADLRRFRRLAGIEPADVAAKPVC
jgi:MFS family permease